MASQTRKITLDTAALFFGRAVGLLLGMVRLNYLATYLGVANFGVLNFAAYFTALFQSLFDLGMAQLMIREISRNSSRSKELMGSVIVLKVMIVFVAGLLVGIVTLLSGFDTVTNWAVLLTTVALAINGISMVFLSAFQAHRKMITVSIANIANDAIISAAIILLIPSFPNIVTALSLTITVSLINLGILITVYYKQVGKPQYQVDAQSWKLMLREGGPMAVSALGISTYTFIGPTMLKYYRGGTEVGVYSAGFKLISILTLVPTAFTQIVFPVFSSFLTAAPHKLSKALQDSLRVMLEISIPLAVGTIILAPRIIATLYPPEFSASVPVLQFLIAGNALGYLAWILYTFLLALNHQKFCMWNSLGVAASALIASILVIPTFGFVGVAVVTMATDTILFITLMSYVVQIGYTFNDVTLFGKVIGSAIVMGIAVYTLQNLPLALVITIGVCIYGTMLFMTRVFGDQEREVISRILNRQ